MKVEGLVAMVTGGGSGMGRDLVVQLAKAGCHVAFCDVSQAGIDETVKLAQATARKGIRVMGGKVDVTDREGLQRFAEEVVSKNNDKLHLLFANAGIASHGPLIHDANATAEQIASKEREWDRCFEIDFFGVLYTLRAFLPHIVRQDKGYVVVTSSVNGFWTWPEHSCYTAAKFGVRGLTESLLVETYAKAPHVQVACVHPGGVRTNIVRNSTFAKNKEGKTSDITGDFDKIAGLSSAEAAEWILDGVARDHTRILVGYDAVLWDKMNRLSPHGGYKVFGALGREGIAQWDPTRASENIVQAKKVSLLGWLRFLKDGGLFFLIFSAPATAMNLIRQLTGASASQVLTLSAILALVKLQRSSRSRI
ncbi:Dehydrogenase/reductase SDR family protein 7-like [Hondaea fermentalgiana]|uniref:Dehydrogenase/reductase SDR family protein 7-like n=1 Tax=Hondaea fermentalgiana TaxID=2315210 RepID=A0A2R5GMP9_9STRA|nr:Dehydrogenase/reductase SDR family protein 7-like [Hondaea fermentalgiana]|eukprot:GBG32172.1 Dehydrogenase/reductase SDR family protein 7-like [Hondaea fermentalgiana]